MTESPRGSSCNAYYVTAKVKNSGLFTAARKLVFSFY
jgi:hypothetical protein